MMNLYLEQLCRATTDLVKELTLFVKQYRHAKFGRTSDG